MIFLGLTLFAIVVQGLFALFEMSILSLSRVRLQYFAALGKKRAVWLSLLLKSPTTFFGAILIGINGALQIGSECSRRFYEAINLDPGLAPISQVILVVIFGELVPMFVARRHPTQIALGLTPFIVVFSKILFPITWALSIVSSLIQRLFGSHKEIIPLFSREEVAIAFRQRQEGEDELYTLTEKIFQCKNRTAGELMTPLAGMLSAPISATVADVGELLSHRYEPVIAIYRGQKRHVLAIVHVRDLLLLGPKEPIFGKTKPPWFVTKETSLLEILEQFRRNNQSVAIVLDTSLQTCGILTLDQIISELFGKEAAVSEVPSQLYIERTLSGEMLIHAFNLEFHAKLPGGVEDTLSDWIFTQLGHPPAIGETVLFDPFVFTVLEPTLRGVAFVSVRSV
jgi:CBS domain containing-hemolysin-like protein